MLVQKNRHLKALLLGVCALSLQSCGSETETAHTHQDADHAPVNQASSNIELAAFGKDALIGTPETVSCQLENGEDASCLKLTVAHLPDSLEIGPFCPATMDDQGGIWDWTGQDAGLYRVNGSFLRKLDALGYRFFDDDGTVYSTDIAIQEPAQDHSCINVSLDETVEITVLIPLNPVKAETTTSLGVVDKIGLALSGTPIFSDAPSIQHTGHMPALDTCGGHVDPGGWYHWHANSSDIEAVFTETGVVADCALPQNSAALFAYAFDGYPIYGSLEADGDTPDDLDNCGGHDGVTVNGDETYHYHTPTGFPNLPNCLSGVAAKDNFSTTAQVGIGANPPEGTAITRGSPPRGGGPGGGAGGPPPGFAQAAEKLGVSEEAFAKAMLEAGGREADLSVVAAALGVREEDLQDALPARPPGR